VRGASLPNSLYNVLGWWDGEGEAAWGDVICHWRRENRCLSLVHIE